MLRGRESPVGTAFDESQGVGSPAQELEPAVPLPHEADLQSRFGSDQGGQALGSGFVGDPGSELQRGGPSEAQPEPDFQVVIESRKLVAVAGVQRALFRNSEWLQPNGRGRGRSPKPVGPPGLALQQQTSKEERNQHPEQPGPLRPAGRQPIRRYPIDCEQETDHQQRRHSQQDHRLSQAESSQHRQGGRPHAYQTSSA